MDRSQAETIVATIQAYFPRPELPDSTVRAWADELEPFDFGDAQEAARRLARDYRYPVLAEMVGLVDEVRRERERLAYEDTPVLPPVEAVEMPVEVRELIDRMTDPERKRQKREAEWAEEDAAWERRKAEIRSKPLRPGMCAGAGKIPVELKDGSRVCPDCGAEIPDIIAAPLPKPKRRTSWKTGDRW